MDTRTIFGVAALVSIIAIIGVTGIFAGIGAGTPIWTAVFGEDPEPAKLNSFGTGPVHCIEDDHINSSTSVDASGVNTHITYARNVTLPNRSYGIGNASFEQVNESAYALSVEIKPMNNTERACAGVVRYNGSMQIPAGDDPWSLIIKHNNETITTLHGFSNSTLLGGSAGVSQNVSAPPPENTTTTPD
jgi:hypothetical protein